MTLSSPQGYRFTRRRLTLVTNHVACAKPHTLIVLDGSYVVAEIMPPFGDEPEFSLLVLGSIPEISVLHTDRVPTYPTCQEAVEAVLTAMCGPELES